MAGRVSKMRVYCLITSIVLLPDTNLATHLYTLPSSKEAWIPIAETNETAPTVPTAFSAVSAVTAPVATAIPAALYNVASSAVLALLASPSTTADQVVQAAQANTAATAIKVLKAPKAAPVKPATERQAGPVYSPTKRPQLTEDSKSTAAFYVHSIAGINPVFKASTTSKPQTTTTSVLPTPELSTASANHLTFTSSRNTEEDGSNDLTVTSSRNFEVDSYNDQTVIGQVNISREGQSTSKLTEKKPIFSTKDTPPKGSFREFSIAWKDTLNKEVINSLEKVAGHDSRDHQTGHISTFLFSLVNSIFTKRQLGAQQPSTEISSTQPPHGTQLLERQFPGTQLSRKKLHGGQLLGTQLPATQVPRKLMFGRPRQLYWPEVPTHGANIFNYKRAGGSEASNVITASRRILQDSVEPKSTLTLERSENFLINPAGGSGAAVEAHEDDTEDDAIFQDLLQHLQNYEKDDEYVPQAPENQENVKIKPRTDYGNPIAAAFNRFFNLYNPLKLERIIPSAVQSADSKDLTINKSHGRLESVYSTDHAVKRIHEQLETPRFQSSASGPVHQHPVQQNQDLAEILDRVLTQALKDPIPVAIVGTVFVTLVATSFIAARTTGPRSTLRKVNVAAENATLTCPTGQRIQEILNEEELDSFVTRAREERYVELVKKSSRMADGPEGIVGYYCSQDSPSPPKHIKKGTQGHKKGIDISLKADGAGSDGKGGSRVDISVNGVSITVGGAEENQEGGIQKQEFNKLKQEVNRHKQELNRQKQGNQEQKQPQLQHDKKKHKQQEQQHDKQKQTQLQHDKHKQQQQQRHDKQPQPQQNKQEQEQQHQDDTHLQQKKQHAQKIHKQQQHDKKIIRQKKRKEDNGSRGRTSSVDSTTDDPSTYSESITEITQASLSSDLLFLEGEDDLLRPEVAAEIRDLFSDFQGAIFSRIKSMENFVADKLFKQ